MKPVCGRIYTLQQIETDLELSDSAHLGFYYKGAECVIQTSHITKEQLLSVQAGDYKLADTNWMFILETYEWIPVFRAVSDSDVIRLMDIELDVGSVGWGYWVTPKGFPRENPAKQFRDDLELE